MLEGLLEFDAGDFQEAEHFSAAELVNAKFTTAELLAELGAPNDASVITDAERQTARSAFSALTLTTSPSEQFNAVTRVDTPLAVKHLVGMLTAYDWEFVQQANELRGYCVAKILEETKHPEAKTRLRALELLGRVTEIALFTERSEVKHIHVTDEELEKELRAKLERFMGTIVPIEEEKADGTA